MMSNSDDIQSDLSDTDFAEVTPADDGEDEDGPEQIWSHGPPIPWVQVQTDLYEYGLTGNVVYDPVTGTNLIMNIFPLPQDGGPNGDGQDVAMPPSRDALLSEAPILPGNPVEIWNENGAWQSGFRAVSDVQEGEAGPEIDLCWEVEWQAATAEDRQPAALPWPAAYVRRV